MFLFIICSGILVLAPAEVFGGDITNCGKEILEKCNLDDYFVSTLEIVDRELTRDRKKANDYFTRQVCRNSHEEMIDFKRCVFSEVGAHCWLWDGVFDSMRLLNTEDKRVNLAKRYEQLYVILEYNVCGDEDLKAEYIDIRSCSHRRIMSEAGIGFHDHYVKCLEDPNYPNPIQDAMDKMDLCRGKNRDYSCFVNSLLGDQCAKVKTALLRYAEMHAGHAGLHEGELSHITFILQAAYSDHLRLPKPTECHMLMFKQGSQIMPTSVYYLLLALSGAVVAGLVFHFRDTIMALGEHYLISK